MTKEEAIQLLLRHDNLSEDALTQIAQAFGYKDLDRNKFHDLGAKSGQMALSGRIQRDFGSLDQALNTARSQDAAAKQPAPPTMPDLGVTPQDRALVEQSIGAAGDIARRELERQMPQLLDQASASAGARGISGGSGEVASRAIVGAEAQRSLADMLSRESIAGGQALLQLPFQRAGVELGFNEQLFNQFIQSSTLDFQRQAFGDTMALEREKQRYQRQQAKWNVLGNIIKAGVSFIPNPNAKKG